MTFEDDEYSNFMTKIMQNLEIRKIYKDYYEDSDHTRDYFVKTLIENEILRAATIKKVK